MAEKDDILSKLKRNEKPGVPEGFFENFSDRLSREVETEDSVLSQLKKVEKPMVPSGYFDQVADRVFDKIESETKPKQRGNIKYLYWVSGIAAIFCLFFFLPFNKGNDGALAEQSELTESDEILLAYVSEEDITDYLVEMSELSIEDEESEEDLYYDELESGLYDYINEL